MKKWLMVLLLIPIILTAAYTSINLMETPHMIGVKNDYFVLFGDTLELTDDNDTDTLIVKNIPIDRYMYWATITTGDCDSIFMNWSEYNQRLSDANIVWQDSVWTGDDKTMTTFFHDYYWYGARFGAIRYISTKDENTQSYVWYIPLAR